MAEYIEREKAINAVFEAFADGRSAYIALEAIPAADVRPVKRGKWIPPKFPYPWYKASCSCCGYEDPFSHGGCSEWNGVEWKAMNFCPNCGAEMREEEQA